MRNSGDEQIEAILYNKSLFKAESICQLICLFSVYQLIYFLKNITIKFFISKKKTNAKSRGKPSDSDDIYISENPTYSQSLDVISLILTRYIKINTKYNIIKYRVFTSILMYNQFHSHSDLLDLTKFMCSCSHSTVIM